MYKVVTVWTAPPQEQRDDFLKHYFDIHVPKAARMPNLKKFILVQNEHSTQGEWYGSAELAYDNKEAFQECLASDEWQEVAADTRYMESTFHVSLKVLLGEENHYAIG